MWTPEEKLTRDQVKVGSIRKYPHKATDFATAAMNILKKHPNGLPKKHQCWDGKLKGSTPSWDGIFYNPHTDASGKPTGRRETNPNPVASDAELAAEALMLY
jgi:hypothetical protein